MEENTNEIDYLIYCDSMTPEERFLKGIELSEWNSIINKFFDQEFQKLLENVYVLR